MTNEQFSQEVRTALCAGIAAGRDLAEIEIALEGSPLWEQLTTPPQLFWLRKKRADAQAKLDALVDNTVGKTKTMLAATAVIHYDAKIMAFERGLNL